MRKSLSFEKLLGANIGCLLTKQGQNCIPGYLPSYIIICYKNNPWKILES